MFRPKVLSQHDRISIENIEVYICLFGLMNPLGHFPCGDIMVAEIWLHFVKRGKFLVKLLRLWTKQHFDIARLAAVRVQLHEPAIRLPFHGDSSIQPEIHTFNCRRMIGQQVQTFFATNRMSADLVPSANCFQERFFQPRPGFLYHVISADLVCLERNRCC